MNCYEILGINFNATTEEITTAFRTLAKKYHPDLNEETNSHEIFVNIVEAYEILKDVDKRKVYDILINRTKYNENDLYKKGEKYINEWKNNARKEGEYYAKNKFHVFEKNILDKLKNVAIKTAIVGIKVGKISVKTIVVYSIIILAVIAVTVIIPGVIAGVVYLINRIINIIKYIMGISKNFSF
jgi:hypothetical protein